MAPAPKRVAMATAERMVTVMVDYCRRKSKSQE